MNNKTISPEERIKNAITYMDNSKIDLILNVPAPGTAAYFCTQTILQHFNNIKKRLHHQIDESISNKGEK